MSIDSRQAGRSPDPSEVLFSVNPALGNRGEAGLSVQKLLQQALAVHQQGDASQAAHLYRAVLQVQPDLADAQHLYGVALSQAGDLAGGEAWVRKALAQNDQLGAYHNSLGRILMLRGEMDAALAELHAALQLSPQNAESYFNLAEAEFANRQYESAIPHYEQALLLEPTHAQARFGLAQAVRLSQGWAAALPHYQLAASMVPDAPLGQYHWALALHMGGHHAQAQRVYRAVVERWPAMVDAWAGLGSTYFAANQMKESIAAYEEALKHQPDNAMVLDGLVEARRKACDWRDDMAAVEQRLLDRTRRDLADGKPAPVRIFTAMYTPFNASELLQIARSNALQARPTDCTPRWGAPAQADGRLRIGYLLADARDHPNAHNMLSVFERHDRERFEVFTYSWGVDDNSAYRRRIRDGSEHFIELRGQSDEAMARRIAADGVQVLVDLMGHTADNRVGVLWRKPAPVQMNYLGFPGSSGAECVDYVLADRWVCPLGHDEEMSEHIVRLPHCYNPLAHHAELTVPPAPSRAEVGLPANSFVYCCFNSPNKISAEDFARWMRILGRAEGSILWLYRANDLVEGNLRAAAARHGVDPKRLYFAPHLPRDWHLARLQVADLFLDTTPYGAHTTTGDALRAGVPVLTVAGETFPARVAASMLDAAGLTECIAPDWQSSEDQAVALATSGIAQLKAKLAKPLGLPLFDIQRQVKDLEWAYRHAFDLWLADGSTAAFEVPASQGAGA